MMVARWEWPPENSLFEVQQAIEWSVAARAKMHELAAAPQGFGGSFSRRMMAAAARRWIRTR